MATTEEEFAATVVAESFIKNVTFWADRKTQPEGDERNSSSDFIGTCNRFLHHPSWSFKPKGGQQVAFHPFSRPFSVHVRSSLHSQRFWILAHIWMMNYRVKSDALFEFLDMKVPKFMNQKAASFHDFFPLWNWLRAVRGLQVSFLVLAWFLCFGF
mgnify:CR=1 FL=1